MTSVQLGHGERRRIGAAGLLRLVRHIVAHGGCLVAVVVAVVVVVVVVVVVERRREMKNVARWQVAISDALELPPRGPTSLSFFEEVKVGARSDD